MVEAGWHAGLTGGDQPAEQVKAGQAEVGKPQVCGQAWGSRLPRLGLYPPPPLTPLIAHTQFHLLRAVLGPMTLWGAAPIPRLKVIGLKETEGSRGRHGRNRMGQFSLSLHQGSLHSSLLQEASRTAPGVKDPFSELRLSIPPGSSNQALGSVICPSFTGI